MTLVALAAAVAPLPPGVAASGAPAVPGVYAEQLNFGDIGVNEALATLDRDCAARGRTAEVEGRALQWRGSMRLYRSAAGVAVWQDRPALEPQGDCAARLTLRQSVTIRAGADAARDSGHWQPAERCVRFRRCRTGLIAGVPAACIDTGDGLVGAWRCTASSAGLLRGLTLSWSQYSDDGSLPDSGWEMSRVLPDAALDPVVFRQP